MAIDRDRVLRSAEKYAARNRYAQAIEQYQKLLGQTPNDARLLLKVGDLYARMHAHAWAVDAYARAGRSYADEGFAAKAVAVYKQVQQCIDNEAPHLADYYLYVYPTLANLYQELRLAVEALGMYDAYASMLTRCGRLREAAAILKVVVERGGDNPLTRLRLAELLLEEGDEADALAHFSAAANALVAAGRLDDALRVVDHTLSRVQDPAMARRAAEIHLDRGEGNDGMQALVRLQQAFQAQPKNLETLALLARAFEAIHQKDRAFEVRKETVRIAMAQGAMDTAQAVLATLRAEAPHDPAVLALAQTLEPAPPSTRAAIVATPAPPPVPSEILQELVRRTPLKDLRGFRGGGAIADAIEEAEFFASRGLFEDALAIVEEQLASSPEDPTLLAFAVRIRTESDSASVAQPSVLGVGVPTQQATRVSQGADPAFLENALADMEPSVERDGGIDVDALFEAIKAGTSAQVGEEDREVHYDLGVANLELGRLSAAIEAFRKAAMDPSRACVSLSMIAAAYQRQGNLKEALEALQQAAQVPRKTREEEVGIHYELASLHEARGEPELAVHHFEQVVHLSPDFRDARSRLKALRRPD